MTRKYPDFSILLFYVFSTFLMIIIQILIIAFYPDILDDDELLTRFSSISNLAWYAGLFLVFIYFYREFLLAALIKFKNNLTLSIGYVVAGMGIMFGAALISGMILLSLVGDEVPENQEAIELIFNGGGFDRAAIIITTILLAPLVEELVFRKSLFQLFKKLPNSLIIIFSSLAFGAIHIIGDNPAQIIYYFALGLGLGFMYHFSEKNFAVVVIMHMIVNTLVTLAMLYA